MTNDWVIKLDPEHEHVEMALSSGACHIRLDEPKASLIFALAPALLLDAADSTDYTLYYNLSKG